MQIVLGVIISLTSMFGLWLLSSFSTGGCASLRFSRKHSRAGRCITQWNTTAESVRKRYSVQSIAMISLWLFPRTTMTAADKFHSFVALAPHKRTVRKHPQVNIEIKYYVPLSNDAANPNNNREKQISNGEIVESLLLDKELSDTSLQGTYGGIIKASLNVLAARSPVFRSMLCGNSKRSRILFVLNIPPRFSQQRSTLFTTTKYKVWITSLARTTRWPCFQLL